MSLSSISSFSRFGLVIGLALGALCVPGAARAQQNSDGSVYSRFGLGELYTNGSSQVQAMGGGGTALSSFNYVNLANPGSWADQVITRLAGGVTFQGLDIEDASGTSSRLNSSLLGAFQFSFPMKQGKMGFVAAFTPYSRVAHSVLRNQVIIDDPTLTDPAAYSIRFEGSGGLQTITTGIGYRVNKNVSLGGAVNFNFGILQESRFTEFNSGDFASTRLNLSTRLAGFSGSLGGLFTFRELTSDQDAITVGISLSTRTRLDGTQTVTTGSAAEPDTLGTPVDGKLNVPLRANMGLAYYLNRRWTFVVDGTIEPWDQLDGDLALAGFSPDGASLLDKRTRFSAGLEFMPTVNPLDPYFKRAAYRLGGYTDSGYVVPQTGVSFKTMALTGGLSLPTLFPGTHIDIGFEVGRRGNTDFGYVRESFYKIIVNMNIGERWFDRRKLG
ncbi:MAG: hypothetical protein R2834_08405 [Rhodothermales bacterium]